MWSVCTSGQDHFQTEAAARGDHVWCGGLWMRRSSWRTAGSHAPLSAEAHASMVQHDFDINISLILNQACVCMDCCILQQVQLPRHCVFMAGNLPNSPCLNLLQILLLQLQR